MFMSFVYGSAKAWKYYTVVAIMWSILPCCVIPKHIKVHRREVTGWNENTHCYICAKCLF